MRKIFFDTIKIEVIICIFVSSAMFYKGESFGWIAYKTFFIFGGYFFPILIASAIYYFGMRKRFQIDAGIAAFFLQVFLLFILFQVGLFAWAALNVMNYQGFFSLTIAAILADYQKEFLPAAPLTILVALAYPLLDWFTELQEEEEEFQG